MKKYILSAAVLSIALMGTEAFAQDGEKKRSRGDKPGAAEAGNRGAAARRSRGQQMDPAKMVARMMQEFDKDGDQKLDSTELTALLKSMRERSARGGRRGGQDGGQAGGPGGRRRQAEAGGAAGGSKPKRPKAE